MDIKQIRQFVKEHGTVVLVEEGHPPLIVKEISPPRREAVGAPTEASEEEVPISARWPKARPSVPVSQDSVLERLNKEILALREQIAQEEAQTAGETH